jgi:hypothetical protein
MVFTPLEDSFILEIKPDLQPCFEELRLGGPNRASQRFGYFLMLEALDIVEQENASQFSRQ